MLVQVGRRFVSEQKDIDPQFAKGMRELLSKSKVFHDCHEEFIRDLIVSSNRKEHAPNRYLMEEGQRGDSMFVLFKGVVEVTANGRYICKLRDGSIVGEAALLNVDNRRTASVRSVQKCDVAIIFRSTFHSILEKYPWEKKKFQREMKAKLMELGKLIDMKDDINLEQQAIQCDALKRVPFFANDESLHDFVAELAMNASSYWYRPGRVIIQEGDTRCDEMYVLLKGAVEITACGEFLGRLENDLFGEICVLDLLERRTANVIAATQCHCMVFTRQIVIPVLAKYPDARMKLLEHARRRLVALNSAIGNDAESTESRVANQSQREGCAIGYGNSMNSADAHLFSSSPVFKTGSVDFLRELSMRLTSKKFEEGRTVIQEGNRCVPENDSMYLIVKGQAEVWKSGNFVTLLGEGQVFGEMGMYFGSIRHATVKAKTKLVTRLICGRALQELLKQYPKEAFVPQFEEEVQRRHEQLGVKEQLRSKTAVKPANIDFMFMKLPHTKEDGTRVPVHEPLGNFLNDTCKIATSARGPGASKLAALPGSMGLSAR